MSEYIPFGIGSLGRAVSSHDYPARDARQTCVPCTERTMTHEYDDLQSAMTYKVTVAVSPLCAETLAPSPDIMYV